MAHTMNTGTIVAIVGDQSEDALANLDGIRGVEVLALQGSEPALAARRIAAAGTPWIVHDADPLEHVAAAWVELFEERSTLGALEFEVETALAMFEDGSALMPDYYIVLEPEGAPGHLAALVVRRARPPCAAARAHLAGADDAAGCRSPAPAEQPPVIATLARPRFVAAPPSVRDPRPRGSARRHMTRSADPWRWAWAVALPVGVAGAVIGLVPWLIGGGRLPPQALWSATVRPEAMPFVLLPFSFVTVILIFSLLDRRLGRRRHRRTRTARSAAGAWSCWWSAC